MKVIPDTHRAH